MLSAGDPLGLVGCGGPWIYLVLIHPTDARCDCVLEIFDQHFFFLFVFLVREVCVKVEST